MPHIPTYMIFRSPRSIPSRDYYYDCVAFIFIPKMEPQRMEVGVYFLKQTVCRCVFVPNHVFEQHYQTDVMEAQDVRLTHIQRAYAMIVGIIRMADEDDCDIQLRTDVDTFRQRWASTTRAQMYTSTRSMNRGELRLDRILQREEDQDGFDHHIISERPDLILWLLHIPVTTFLTDD